MNLTDALRPILIHWAIDQLASFPNGVDWVALKAQINAQVATIVPNAALDKPIDALVDEVIDGIHDACMDRADETALVTACFNKQWDVARAAMKALLLKVIAPTMAQKALIAIL